MEIPAVLALARQLMDEHGLESWGLGLDRARRRAGLTNHTERRITLSRALMELYGEADVRETILHEIAHARVGAHHHHDAVWVAEARRLGSTGQRLVGEQAPKIEGRWVGHCPAGHRITRMRRPASPCSCSRCARSFSLDHLITWSLDGTPMRPEQISPRYARTLARIRREFR